MGWLHWSETQLLEADMNSVVLGYQGMREMLQAIFGKGEPPKQVNPMEAMGIDFKPLSSPGPREVPVITAPTDKMPKLTPEAFDKMFVGIKGKPH